MEEYSSVHDSSLCRTNSWKCLAWWTMENCKKRTRGGGWEETKTKAMIAQRREALVDMIVMVMMIMINTGNVA